MSAYGREMEREYSARSILAGEGSEPGSNYTNEAGIYMSSFAATVFISGLVTAGISILSLLVALTVMLNSCESRNSGVLEMYRNSNNYEYCRTFGLHAELNSLNAEVCPEVCKDFYIRYVKEGLYRRDLNITGAIIEDFFSSIRPKNDRRDVVLMDADDFLSERFYADHLIYRISTDFLHDDNQKANYLRHIFALELYRKLQFGRWPLILFSRKTERLRNSTVEYLISMGCHGLSSIIMRTDNEMQMDYTEYLSTQRSMLQREGFRIKAVISSKMDALKGPCLGERVFKLPYPVFRGNVEDDGEKRKRQV